MKQLALLLLLALPISAIAGQDAMISGKTAEIYESPSTESVVIETRKGGEKIRVSNFHKDGFYKLRTNNGRYGWISQDSIAINYDSPEIKAANLNLLGERRVEYERAYPWFFLRPMVMSLGYSSINAGGFHMLHKFAAGGRLDMMFRVDKYLKIATRMGYYTTGSEGNQFFSVIRQGFPLMGGFELDLTKSRFTQSAISVTGGFDFHRISLIAVKAASPDVVVSRAADPIVMLSYIFKWTINPKAWFDLELGGYFSPKSSHTIGNEAFLNPAGDPKSVNSRFSGPMLSAGFEFAF